MAHLTSLLPGMRATADCHFLVLVNWEFPLNALDLNRAIESVATTSTGRLTSVAPEWFVIAGGDCPADWQKTVLATRCCFTMPPL